jgi:hypothetical protein
MICVTRDKRAQDFVSWKAVAGNYLLLLVFLMLQGMS